MGTVYNLEYEFSTQNGQTMVFAKKDDNRLTPEDLHAVQLKMLQTNKIPHLLALSLENIDLIVRLHYDIQSKQRLISYLRDNKTTMNDYYQLFLSIINALEDASSYMLDQNNYLLKKEFLYVGQHAGDVYLTYLPVKGIEKKMSVTEDLKQLLTDVAGEIESLQGNEFKSILNYIKNSSFSISGLKKLLLELIAMRSNVNPQHVSQHDVQTHDAESEPVQVTGESSGASNLKIIPGSENRKNTDHQKEKLPSLTSRQKLYTILGAVLLIAFSWKLYEMNPNNLMFSVAVILSVLTVAGVVTYWKFWRPGNSPTIIKKTGASKERMKEEKTRNDERKQPAHAVQEPQTLHGRETFQAQQKAYQQMFTADHSAAAAVDTTLLNIDHDDTVLLEDEAELEGHEQPTIVTRPVLTRTSEDGEPIQIEISSDSFIIGRNEAAVHFVETALGVSRIHVEIVKINEASYGIKDLGSKNGSKLNGAPMVPYKLYALNEDDEITIGKAKYTFNWSSGQ